MAATDWVAIKKDVATSADLGTGGKAPAATAAPKVKPDEADKLPPIEEAKVEEISLPRKAGCACVEVAKCACQAKAEDTQAAPPVDGESEADFAARCAAGDKARAEVCAAQWQGEAKPTAKAEVSLQTDAPPDKRIEPGAEPKGVMLALWMPNGVAKSLSLDGGENPDDMHVTLGYFGKVGKDLSEEQTGMIYKCASAHATDSQPIKGKVSGIGRFTGSETSDGKDVMYASVDAPGLGKFRHSLMEQIAKCADVIKSEIHDFTPHVTLKYVGKDEASPIHRVDHHEIEFAHLVMAVGKERRLIPLGEVQQTVKRWCPIIKADARLVTGIVLQPEVVDAQQDIIGEQAIADAAHAFVANYNARTKIGVQHSVPAGSPPAMFPAGVHLVESYVTPIEMVLNGRVVKKGTWMMTVFVEDDAIWERVKNGSIRGFSIGGIAKVQRLAA